MTEQPPDEMRFWPHAMEKCQCGGLLWADYADPADVSRHVKHHQRALRHREWAAKQGYAGYDLGAL